jgi:hypothetical protein
MSGKKRDKFRMTLALACNADSTEKLPIFFIGRYLQNESTRSNAHSETGIVRVLDDPQYLAP